jgi:hypothetical protein
VNDRQKDGIGGKPSFSCPKKYQAKQSRRDECIDEKTDVSDQKKQMSKV